VDAPSKERQAFRKGGEGRMNLQRLFNVQEVLRERINYNEPDRPFKLILALLTEIGECANEQRTWKFWSKDQHPRVWRARAPYMDIDDADFYNPVLEEFIDGFHFVIELGIEINVSIEELKDQIIPEIYPMQDDITQQFLVVHQYAALMKEDDYYYELFNEYLNLGKMLGFTWEQIEQAYLDKNKINHLRQDSGY
jgi:dimeric dUTPase (all-alpha-NTP-PPase superfamily)